MPFTIDITIIAITRVDLPINGVDRKCVFFLRTLVPSTVGVLRRPKPVDFVFDCGPKRMEQEAHISAILFVCGPFVSRERGASAAIKKVPADPIAANVLAESRTVCATLNLAYNTRHKWLSEAAAGLFLSSWLIRGMYRYRRVWHCM